MVQCTGQWKVRTNEGAQEVPARVSGLGSNADEYGRIADAGVVVHEGVLLQVNARRCRAVADATGTHSCTPHGGCQIDNQT